MLRDGVTWLLFHRSNIPNMRWKATVIVRIFQYLSFIWSVNNNNFFSLKYVKLCAWKSVIKNFKDSKPIESSKHKKHNQIWTKITTPQQNTRKKIVRKTNKKRGKKKEGNHPKPLPSFSFFRPLLFLLPARGGFRFEKVFLRGVLLHYFNML